MTDILGLARLFERARQITMSMEINGETCPVALNEREREAVQQACRRASEAVGNGEREVTTSGQGPSRFA